MTATLDRHYSRAEVALRLGVSPVRVDQLALSGRLPYIQTSLGKLYDADAVQALAAERAARGQPAPPDTAA
jgi:hypothetical protein